jgi:hypothetical protein
MGFFKGWLQGLPQDHFLYFCLESSGPALGFDIPVSPTFGSMFGAIEGSKQVFAGLIEYSSARNPSRFIVPIALTPPGEQEKVRLICFFLQHSHDRTPKKVVGNTSCAHDNVLIEMKETLHGPNKLPMLEVAFNGERVGQLQPFPVICNVGFRPPQGPCSLR